MQSFKIVSGLAIGAIVVPMVYKWFTGSSEVSQKKKGRKQRKVNNGRKIVEKGMKLKKEENETKIGSRREENRKKVVDLPLGYLLHGKRHDLLTRQFRAAAENDVVMLREAIMMTKRPHVRNQFGETPLHFAAQEGSLDACQMLMRDFGVNPNVIDYAGWSPLHVAALGNHLAVIDMLIRYGANPLHETFVGHYLAAECVDKNKMFGEESFNLLMRAEKNLRETTGRFFRVTTDVVDNNGQILAHQFEQVQRTVPYPRRKAYRTPKGTDIMWAVSNRRRGNLGELPKYPKWNVKVKRTGQFIDIRSVELTATAIREAEVYNERLTGSRKRTSVDLEKCEISTKERKLDIMISKAIKRKAEEMEDARMGISIKRSKSTDDIIDLLST